MGEFQIATPGLFAPEEIILNSSCALACCVRPSAAAATKAAIRIGMPGSWIDRFLDLDSLDSKRVLNQQSGQSPPVHGPDQAQDECSADAPPDFHSPPPVLAPTCDCG